MKTLPIALVLAMNGLAQAQDFASSVPPIVGVSIPVTVECSYGVVLLVPGRDIMLSVGDANEKAVIQIPLGRVTPEGRVEFRPNLSSDLLRAAVNTDGVAEATRIEESGGVIRLR